MSDSNEGTVITYFDGIVPVLVGDRVEIRVLFRKRVGRIAHVPGVSRPHPEFEFGGLRWVGIDIPRGPVVKAIVDPETHRLRKNVTFMRHDAEDATDLDPSIELT